MVWSGNKVQYLHPFAVTANRSSALFSSTRFNELTERIRKNQTKLMLSICANNGQFNSALFVKGVSEIDLRRAGKPENI